MLFILIDANTNQTIPVRQLDGFARAAWLVYNCAMSRNFGKARGRRHTFRLLDARGKIHYRGYCVFPDSSNYGALLRPLIEYGTKHGCCEIAYKVGDHYKRVPLRAALRFARLRGLYNTPREFLELYCLRDLTEADEDQLKNYIDYITKP